MRPSHRFLVLAAAPFLFSALACDGEPNGSSQKGEEDAGESDPPDAGDGTPTACVIDVDCALGSYCDLGACVAGCESENECEDGNICTEYGRCSAAPIVIEADTRGRLDLRPLVFPALDPDDGSVPLTLLARDAAIERIRVVPSDGLALECAVGDEPSEECIFDEGLPDGETRDIGVRATRAGEPDEVRVVRIYTPGHVRAVSVAPTRPSTMAALVVNPAGKWEGVLEAVEDGMLHPTAARTAPSTFQQVPLNATIYAASGSGTGVVVLEDVFGVLHPEGEWIGALDLAAQNTLTLPTYVRHGSLGLDAPTMLRVEARVGVLGFDALSETLFFDIEIETRGSMPEGEGLRSSYRANLRRVGNLPAGATAPTVPAPETFRVEGDTCNVDADCPMFADNSSIPGEGFYIESYRCSADSKCVRAGREPIPWEAIAWEREIVENGYYLDAPGEVSLADSYFRGDVSAPLDYCFFNSDDLEAIRSPYYEGSPMNGFFSIGWGSGPSDPASTRTLAQWRQQSPVYAAFADFFIAQGLAPTSTGALRIDNTSRLPGGADWMRTEIPCELDLPQTDMDFTCGATTTRTFPLTHIDMCDLVAAETGCVIDDDVTTSPVQVPGNDFFGINDPTCTSISGWQMTVTVQRVCRLKQVPDSCSQTVLCGGTGATPPIDALTGEYPCAGGGLAGISADVRAAEAAQTGQIVPTDELFSACLTELDGLFEGKPAASDLQVPLADLLAPSSCIQPTRFFTALGVALSTNHRLRRVNGTDGWEEDIYGRSLRNERVAHRLVQRWLQIHAFLAQEAGDREVLARIVREENVPGENVPDLRAILAASVRGWQLFHHPRYAYALAELDPEVLVSPDWRDELDANLIDARHHEHDKALAVGILETLIAQLNLADEYLELATFASNPSAVDDVRPLFTEAETMRAWATGLMKKADAHAVAQGDVLPWADEFRTAMVNFTTTRNRTVGRAIALLEGKNPLGIEDSDLPLYFFGDQQDPGSRFSAISDFLLGEVGTAQVGWATQLIDSADVSFQSARTRWLDLKNRGWQAARDTAAQEDKEAQVRIGYGDAINDLCFLDSASYDVLDLPSLDHTSCFVKTSDPACLADFRTYARRATRDDVTLQLCVAGALIDQGFLGVAFGDAQLTALATEYATSDNPCSAISYDPECTTFGDAGCYTCSLASGTVTAPVSPETMRVTSDASMANAVARAQEECRARWPAARVAIPFATSLENPACLRGAMGESTLTIVAAARDIEIAKAELDEHQEGYDKLMEGCIALQTAADKIEDANDAHEETMTALRGSKLGADIVANVAVGVKDCTNSAVSAIGAFDPASKVAAGAVSAGACAAATAETAANIASDVFQFQMDNAQLAHENAVDKLERTADISVCIAEAELQFVGQRAATLRIQRAVDDMVLAMYALDSQKRLVEALFFEGKMELARIVGRAVSPPTAGQWLDEDVREFSRRMRLARRVTYLAVRALEYEFQSSLALRSTVLNAVSPNELRAVSDDLRTVSATGGINGNLPTDLKVVLSLREHLMQVAPQTSANGTQVSDVERFRFLLASERYKTYDELGNFTGIAIPFELAPLEVLGLGSSAGIGIIASQDCAERLWSANASIVGSANVLRGGSSFTRMDLRKRNTFYSQWCGAPGNGAQFQDASVRPSRNLFREPGVGTAVGDSVLGVSRGTGAFTRARLQPAINVPRDQFEDDSYENGQTAELAGRGLYGNYELFIPANMLSLVQQGALTDGLDINELDDILIRLDYVAGSQ